MQYCQRCLNPVGEDVRFCTICGAPVPPRSQVETPSIPAINQNRSSIPNSEVSRLLRGCAWFILSCVLTGIVSILILYVIRSVFVIYLSPILLALVLYKSRNLFFRSNVRDTVDFKRGIFEATARNVQSDQFEQTRTIGGQDHVLRLRAEPNGPQANLTGHVAVEIRCRSTRWTGHLSDGDRFWVKGKWQRDGILHAKRAYNLTTNSVVGEK